MAINWEVVNKLGKNRLLRTSYIWLILVPPLAKLLSTIRSPLDFSQYVPGLIINLSLPFSWQTFYFSAVIISTAGVIYFLRCPEIVKSFSTFAEFKAEGRDLNYLKKYAEKIGQEIPFLKEPTIESSRIDYYMSKGFWQLFDYEKQQNQWAVVISFCLYIIGIALIIWVLVDNFIFVIKQTDWKNFFDFF